MIIITSYAGIIYFKISLRKNFFANVFMLFLLTVS